MKKICFAFNHLQYSDGVSRAAINIANALVEKKDVEVTLRPIYYVDKQITDIISKKVRINPVFGFYFRGFGRIVDMMPKRILHNFIFGKQKYDVEIGFQHGTSTKAVVSNRNEGMERLVWIHTYDEKLELKNYYLRADKVVCVSKNSVGRLIDDLDMPEEKVEYCYNLIDNYEIELLGKEPTDLLDCDCLNFVTVGRLSPEKGYIRLLTVLFRLKDEGYNFRMLIIGDGPQKSELIEYANKCNLNEYVVFLGAQNNPHKYTSKSDLFICSSFREGYSTACTEAVMLGIPVISTLVGGANEIIESAKSGVVVENDEQALYGILKVVLEEPKIIQEWKKTIENTKQNFSIENRILKLQKVLNLE